jgi:hypothetical protein
VKSLREKYPWGKFSSRKKHIKEDTLPGNFSVGKTFPKDKSP